MEKIKKMKDKYYYKMQIIKERKIIFCVRLSMENQNLVTRVGLSITNPTDKYDLEKGKIIARNRCKTIEKLNRSSDGYLHHRVRKPYVYAESIEYPCWKGLSFGAHASRIIKLVSDRVKSETHLYVKSLTPKAKSTTNTATA